MFLTNSLWPGASMMTYSRLGGAEPDLARVDGDVLVALGLQRVHEVGELERHAAPLRDRDELFVLARGQRAGVVEQPADER